MLNITWLRRLPLRIKKKSPQLELEQTKKRFSLVRWIFLEEKKTSNVIYFSETFSEKRVSFFVIVQKKWVVFEETTKICFNDFRRADCIIWNDLERLNLSLWMWESLARLSRGRPPCWTQLTCRVRHLPSAPTSALTLNYFFFLFLLPSTLVYSLQEKASWALEAGQDVEAGKCTLHSNWEGM